MQSYYFYDPHHDRFGRTLGPSPTGPGLVSCHIYKHGPTAVPHTVEDLSTGALDNCIEFSSEKVAAAAWCGVHNRRVTCADLSHFDIESGVYFIRSACVHCGCTYLWDGAQCHVAPAHLRYWKIGQSSNVRARLTSLRNGVPFDLGLIAVVLKSSAEQIDDLERRLLRSCARWAARGEWMKVPLNEQAEFTSVVDGICGRFLTDGPSYLGLNPHLHNRSGEPGFAWPE